MCFVVADLTTMMQYSGMRLEHMNEVSILKWYGLSNATFYWLIDNFSEKRDAAASGNLTRIDSPPFYSGLDGYRMKLTVYPNGHGSGNGHYLSLFVRLLQGPYDDQLTWPYPWQTELIIFDPNRRVDVTKTLDPSDPAHGGDDTWGKPVGQNDGRGWSRFLSLSSLSRYVRNDKLLVAANVLQ